MLAYLSPQTITCSCKEATLDTDVCEALIATANRIAASPGLTAAVQTAHTGIYYGTEVSPETWLAIESLAGAEAEAVYAVLMLDSVRITRERQRARGIPAASYELLHKRHAFYLISEHRRKVGRVGIKRDYAEWFRVVASGYLCRVGLLEYCIAKNRYAVSTFANRVTGEVIALANEGTTYDQDGYCVGPEMWQATLTRTDRAIIGYPIMPGGFALKQKVALPNSEWRCVLHPDSWVLDMHIPEGNTLHADDLRDSLAQAEIFFPRYFPELPAHAAYICESWLFSNLLPRFLPARSNIVHWQNQHYLFPIGDSADGEHSFKSFVWRDGAMDFAQAPRDTRLQRAVLDHVAAGQRLRVGGAFLLQADVSRFGTAPYQIASQRAIERLLAQAE